MLDWLFTSPHPLWQWLASIAGVVALVVAFPPLIHMIWGRPIITIKIKEDGRKINGDIFWQYDIYNMPVQNKLLKLIHVERLTAEGITSLCILTDYKDETKSHRMVAEIQDYEGVLKQRVNIPAGLLPVTVSFMVRDTTGKFRFLGKGLPELTTGRGYILKMGVTRAGKIYTKIKHFALLEEQPYCRWI